MSMTSVTRIAGATIFGASVGIFRQVVVALIRWRQRVDARRQLHMLNELDDRMLADIGLSRGELTFKDANPIWRERELAERHRRRPLIPHSGE